MKSALLALPLLLSAAQSEAAVDLILHSGQIYSLNDAGDRYSAMAVDEDRIVAVGSWDELSSLAGPDTEVLDLNGRTVIPGMQDHHVHPMGAGSAEAECRIAQGADLPTLRSVVENCVDRAEAGQWIRGSQWDAPALGGIPIASQLDDIAPDNPVILTDTSGHSIWVNSLAMELANVDESTTAPAGGVIERLQDGRPSGVFRESAISLVAQAGPPISQEELSQGLAWAVAEMASYGITAFTEAAVGYIRGIEVEMNVVKAFAEKRGMPLRARYCLTWMPGTGTQEMDVDELIAKRNLWAAPNVSVDCIKIFLDGVPTDSHTAAMLEPYSDVVPGRDASSDDRGLLLVEQIVLNEAVARFDGMGLTVKFHAAGDAAVRAGIQAIAYARRQNGLAGPSHNVGHVTFAAPEDFALARDVGAAIEMSPYLWTPTPINDSITEAIGEPRIQRAWAIREALHSRALVIAGSDWAVVPSVNPWLAIETMITRERPGGSEDTFYGTSQAVTLDEALRIFTRNASRHLGQSHELGMLAPGYLADFVIIDRDPWKTPVRELHKTSVEATYVGGNLVFQRNATNESKE